MLFRTYTILLNLVITMKKKEEWERLKEKYAKRPEKIKKPMSKKKLSTIFGIIVLCVSLTVLYIYFNYFAVVVHTDVMSAVSQLSYGETDELIIGSGEENLCYWITPTFNKGHFLEIKKYNSSTNDCYGKLIEISMLPIDGPIDLIGDTDCICNKRTSIKRLEVNGDVFLEVKAI